MSVRHWIIEGDGTCKELGCCEECGSAVVQGRPLCVLCMEKAVPVEIVEIVEVLEAGDLRDHMEAS